MTILIACGKTPEEQEALAWFSQEWKDKLLSRDNNLEIYIWPECPTPQAVQFALIFNQPPGILNQFPNLKGIVTLSAGVDFAVLDPSLPKNIPLARIKDPYMANDIVQYVVAVVLNHVKLLDRWAASQKQKVWAKHPPFTFGDKTIGMMGLGFLGKKAATILHDLGLRVIGWSRSRKNLPGIKDWVGTHEFDSFLSQADICICMLALTPDTQYILNEKTFAKLPKGAYVINLARGDHLVEQDLLNALDSDHLSGACLDVFHTEPLPSEHPFWDHPKIKLTPHIASVTNPETAVSQILENYRRAQSGKTLLNLIDISRGY